MTGKLLRPEKALIRSLNLTRCFYFWLLTCLFAGQIQFAGGQSEPIKNPDRRLQIDEQFRQSLESLAGWCRDQKLEKEWNITATTVFVRDSQRQYIFLPEATGVSIEGLNETWRARWLEARQAYAVGIFELARISVDKHGAEAYQLLHEALHWDPGLVAAREALGHRRVDGEWISQSERLTVRTAAKAHPELGWPARSYQLVTTENFEIASQADEATTRLLAEQLQRWHWVWRQVFFDYWSSPAAVQSWIEGKSKARPTSRKYRIVFFRDREQYVRELERFVGGVGASTGYYNDELKLSFFFASDSHEIIDTWKHELTHQLFQESIRTRNRPFGAQGLWLGEGIAMYLESLRDFGQFVTLGGFDARRLQYARVRKLRDHFYLPFGELASLSLVEFQAHPEVRHLYSQSAGMTQFLMTGNDGSNRANLIDYLRLVYEGTPKKDAWTRVMNLSNEELDLEYAAFLQIAPSDLVNRLIAPAAVSELALPGLKLSPEDFQLLGNCPNLLWLDVSGSELTADRVAALKACQKISQLFASGSTIQAGAIRALAQLQALTELELSHCELSKFDPQEFVAISNLKVLNLSYSKLSRGIDQAIARLDHLETIDLTGATIDPSELKAIREGLPKLDIRR